ncbi:conserved hypothetical protein [Bacillus sp. 349Y]|nr:conserved hypothetical protein [Bacillus sp. 349Y]
MPIMNVKIEKDTQVLKYIPIVRKRTGKSISELKESLENENYILTCNGINIDELLEMKNTIGLLLNAGAAVHIFEGDREVSVEFLDNVIESHMDTERFLEEIDQKRN